MKPVPLVRGLVSVMPQPFPIPGGYYVLFDFITITHIIRIINTLCFLYAVSHACNIVI